LKVKARTAELKVAKALNTFGTEAAPGTELEADPNASYKIVGTDAVGASPELS
jgi:hypothetical protein